MMQPARPGARLRQGQAGRWGGSRDFVDWREQAADTGYEHRSALRPDEVAVPVSSEQRLEVPFRETQHLLAQAFEIGAVSPAPEQMSVGC